MGSAVPLPCFFEVTKSQRLAGQRPQQGTKSCRMGRNSVRPSIRHPSKGSEGQLEGSEGQLVGSEGLREGPEGQLEGPEGLLEGPEGLPERLKGLPEGSESLP